MRFRLHWLALLAKAKRISWAKRSERTGKSSTGSDSDGAPLSASSLQASASTKQARAIDLVRRAENENNLDSRVGLLREALALDPGDKRLELLLSIADHQRQFVQYMRARGQFLRDIGQTAEADAVALTLASVTPGCTVNETARHFPRISDSARPLHSEGGTPNQGAEPSEPPMPRGSGERANWWQNKRLFAYAAVGVCLVLLAVLLLRPSGRRSEVAASSGVVLQVTPPDSAVLVDDRPYSGGALAAGRHVLKVSRPGYQPEEREFFIPIRGPLNVTLRSLTTRISIDVQSGNFQYSVDGAESIKAPTGQSVSLQVEPGRHVVQISTETPKTEARVEFDTFAAGLPRITTLKPGDGLFLVGAAQQGNELTVASTPAGLSLKGVNGVAYGSTTEQGVAVTAAKGGDVIVQSSTAEWLVPTASGDEGSSLTILVRANTPTGTMVISVDEEDVALRLNGKLYARRLRKGSDNFLRGIPLGKYQIVPEREGFRAEPPFEEVRLTNNVEIRKAFKMIPTAMIEVRQARAGSSVVVNGAELGRVGADGRASVRVDAGRCHIELRLPKYKHQALDRQCTAGTTTVVEGTEAKMISTVGWVKIDSIQPAEAKVIARRPGNPDISLSVGTSELPVGIYSLQSSWGNATWNLKDVQIQPETINQVGTVVLK